jgi:hypothetical protein
MFDGIKRFLNRNLLTFQLLHSLAKVQPLVKIQGFKGYASFKGLLTRIYRVFQIPIIFLTSESHPRPNKNSKFRFRNDFDRRDRVS